MVNKGLFRQKTPYMSAFSKLLILLFLITESFGQPSALGDGFQQLCKLCMYLLIPFMFIRPNAKNKEKAKRCTTRTDLYIGWLFVLVFISIINSYLFKDQPVLLSLKSALPTLCVYAVYYLLRKKNLSVLEMNRIFLVLGGVYMFFVIVNLTTFPNIIFGSGEFDEMRGGIRINVPGLYWNSFAFFYFIHLFKTQGKKLYLLFAFVSYLGIIALLGRQTIVISTILWLLFWFHGKKLGAKIRTFAIVTILFVAIVPRIPLVQNMIELQENLNEINEAKDVEDVRIQDYRFFVYDYERNILQYLFGMGVYSKGSAYSDEMEGYIKDSFINTGDAGWAGFFFFYGLISTSILIIMILRCLRYRIPDKCVFVKYQLLFISLCAFAGMTNLAHNEYVIYMFCFYYLEKIKIPKNDSQGNSLLLVRG